MAKVVSFTSTDEIVESGRRFGNAWAQLREYLKKRGENKDKWFDNIILKLDSPTAAGFHKTIRKMIRTFNEVEEGKEFKWNISTEVLSLLSDISKTHSRHAFMTGVFFGYYGYFEKKE